MPAFFPPIVLDIGDVAFDLLRVIVIKRQLPKLFTNFFSGRNEFIDQF